MPVGTIFHGQLLAYEIKSADAEFMDNRHLWQEHQHRDETSETGMSWRLSSIQSTDVGTSPEESCNKGVWTPLSESNKQTWFTGTWKIPSKSSVGNKRRYEDNKGFMCSGPDGKTNEADRFFYQSEGVPYIQQGRIFDLLRVSAVEHSIKQVLQRSASLEKCFCRNRFEPHFTASIWYKHIWKPFPAHVVLGAPKAFAKAAKDGDRAELRTKDRSN